MNVARTLQQHLLPLNRLYYVFDKPGKIVDFSIDPSTSFAVQRNSSGKYAILETWKWDAYHDARFPIRPTDIIVDIGANIGSFSIWAARQATQGMVYAFEPDEHNFALLQTNARRNHCPNIKVFHQAVSDQDGSISFYQQSKENNVNHTMFPDGFATKVDVPSITLESFLRSTGISTIHLLKIDAEGAEYPILLSTPASVFKKIEKIYVEYHDYIDHGHRVETLVKFLQKHGYDVERSGSFFNIYHRFFNAGFLKAYKR